ncbi:MAG: hypothetical protein KatS3mg053_2601 [Candidatus Roseilinea sp.]|nr:MAG: hypothetical protein KatS3mg053_2601 [Candidatus Roseilinea sp.]
MQRSPIAWLYWLLFFACLALVIALNLPWPGLLPQDPGALLRDNWFLWGFNYFGILLMPLAALVIDDALRRKMRWPFYVVPMFVVGILVLSIYMARRPAGDLLKRETPRLLELRWLWWILCAAVILIGAFFLPRGSLPELMDTMSRNLGLTFMWLDIALNQIVALPLAQADMQRRGVAAQAQTSWLIAILLTGPLGLCAYMATRPGVTANFRAPATQAEPA